MRTLLITSALALLLAAGASLAADQHKDVKFSPSKFDKQRGDIIEALEGKQYYEISDDAKRQVIEALDRMSARLQGVGSIDQLGDEDKVAVFNDQELINNLLTNAAADSRLVCTRQKSLGSNMRSNSCMTVAERRRRQEESREQMRRMQRSAPLPAGN